MREHPGGPEGRARHNQWGAIFAYWLTTSSSFALSLHPTIQIGTDANGNKRKLTEFHRGIALHHQKFPGDLSGVENRRKSGKLVAKSENIIPHKSGRMFSYFATSHNTKPPKHNQLTVPQSSTSAGCRGFREVQSTPLKKHTRQSCAYFSIGTGLPLIQYNIQFYKQHIRS